MEAEPKTPSRVVLDPEGDVILVVNDSDLARSGEFVVSSKILSLASPYFSALTGPKFKEGQQLRSGQHQQTRIALYEDNLDAMDSLLKILHFKSLGELNPKEIAMVAIQSDKYHCLTALLPWVQKWCGQGFDQPGLSVADKGHLALAAHLLLPSRDFMLFAKKNIKHLPRYFAANWKKFDIMQTHIPEDLIYQFSICIHETLKSMQNYLEEVEHRLRYQASYFKMAGEQCLRCGGTFNNEIDETGDIRDSEYHCCCDYHNDDAEHRITKNLCTQPARIADYLAILTDAGLWPFSANFLEPYVSVFDIGKKAQGLVEMMNLKHVCEGGVRQCPLLRELKMAMDELKALEGSAGATLSWPEEHSTQLADWGEPTSEPWVGGEDELDGSDSSMGE
ncbi:hypothetical protein B0T19DRAFT_439701 [Cercophora scortea]|uniref:BTB domain-containing protein n=1 Tax=Cercophora scortea TaxID=314031 RepID=A0AAE0MHZ5_9PEZI|nr:hypothetical protein B0T19DRAFT_439701 [Cercophora scortea]